MKFSITDLTKYIENYFKQLLKKNPEKFAKEFLDLDKKLDPYRHIAKKGAILPPKPPSDFDELMKHNYNEKLIRTLVKEIIVKNLN